MQSTENWRPVPGYEGMYEVSNRGAVRGIDRIDSAGRLWRGRVLKQKIRRLAPGSHAVPYRMVNLWRNGRGHMTYVHRAVAEAFIGAPPADDAQVCHDDGDPSNNDVSNLRWGTASDNAWDRVRHGTHFQASKTHCKRGHLLSGKNLMIRKDGYRKCRACMREGATARKAGRAFDQSLSDARYQDVINDRTRSGWNWLDMQTEKYRSLHSYK